MSSRVKLKTPAILGRVILVAFELVFMIKHIKRLEEMDFFYLGVLIIILGIDLWRFQYVKKSERNTKGNIILSSVSVVLMAIYSFSNLEFGGTYFFFATLEGFYLKESNYKKIYLGISILSYLVFSINSSLPFVNYSEFIDGLFNNLVVYIIFIAITFAIVIRKKAKEDIEELNEELIKKNRKLEEYAKNIEALTIERERNRVAQELHDSLGHYLMAISMNVNMIERVDEKKRGIVIEKTKTIVKESIEALRSTVYKFKENEKFDFVKEINILENNLDEIKFRNNIDLDIDKEDDKLKEEIYTTIKESITNGVKHGEATLFIISVEIEKDMIKISIYNNGEIPKDIKNSNGLNGIKERFKERGGEVQFILKDGFEVKGYIRRKTND